jgi:hypothetical protein
VCFEIIRNLRHLKKRGACIESAYIGTSREDYTPLCLAVEKEMKKLFSGFQSVELMLMLKVTRTTVRKKNKTHHIRNNRWKNKTTQDGTQNTEEQPNTG